MASNNFQLVQNLTKAIEKALNESLERKDTEQSTSPTKPPSPPLPSAVLPRWRPPAKKSKKQASKTPKPKKQYTKNVVCIYQKDSGAISIPRGEQRALLTEAGLVAKLNIDHSMSALEIRQEIDNLFAECFGLEHLTYSYLSIMPGSKKLHVPKTSKAFTWDAPQVLSVCTRDTLYILVTSKPIKDPLDRKLKQESFDSTDSDSDEMLLHSPFSDYNPGKAKSDHLSDHKKASSAASMPVPAPTTSSNLFSSYISLMEDEVLEISSDDEEEDDGFTAQSKSNLKPLVEILQDLKNPLASEEAIAYINVRRKAVFEDAVRYVQKKKFNALAMISVRFADDNGSSEGAVDAGGPRREFLRLLLKSVNEDSGIFAGPIHCRTMQANSTARENDYYRICGIVLAWAIVHGGPPPRFFSPSLYNTIAYGLDKDNVFMKDIADPGLKDKMFKIAASNTIEEFKTNLEDPEIMATLEAQGISTALIKSLDEKHRLCQLMVRHIICDAPRSFIEELKAGLNTLGVLSKITEYPEQFREIFTDENIKTLDAQTVDLLFTVDFAEMGSNQRSAQETATVYWRDYLQDCECKEADASLEDVLIFITGAAVPPPLGFDTTPTIQFSLTNALPSANTCATLLTLPCMYKEYETFKHKMDFAILNSPCFGQV